MTTVACTAKGGLFTRDFSASRRVATATIKDSRCTVRIPIPIPDEHAAGNFVNERTTRGPLGQQAKKGQTQVRTNKKFDTTGDGNFRKTKQLIATAFATVAVCPMSPEFFVLGLPSRGVPPLLSGLLFFRDSAVRSYLLKRGL